MLHTAVDDAELLTHSSFG